MTARETEAGIRHRTSLDQRLGRFQQFRNDVLVASADFEDRNGVVVITNVAQHGTPDGAAIQRLTTGLIEIVKGAGRAIDLDLRSTAEERPAPMAESGPEHAGSSQPPADPMCPLAKRLESLWSEGGNHRAATTLASHEGIGKLAIVKGLHEFWEMPLTPEAMALAFEESSSDELAAMFTVLGWIIEQNPSATMSELQAFDDRTGASIKSEGLSLAGRPRDTIALVDRMGPGLQLRPIDEATARSIAAEEIRERSGLLRIQDQSTIRLSFGWVFLYQSTEYLDSGVYSTMVSGNAPLLVDRFTGALWVTGTEYRPDVYVESYLATGDPSRVRLDQPLA